VEWIQFYQQDQVLGNYESIYISIRNYFSTFLLISNNASRSKKAVVINDMHKAIPSVSHMYKFDLLNYILMFSKKTGLWWNYNVVEY
jgi:hypothetical protein